MKTNLITVIEITDSFVKLLHARQRGSRPYLSTCVMQALKEHTEEEVVNILRKMVSENKIPLHGSILSIPRKFMILKHMRLPSHNDAEIRKMVGLQLVKQVPYALEDVIYEHSVLEKEDDGYSKVLGIILHKDMSHRYIDLMKKAGIKIEHMMLSSLGIVEWFNHIAIKNNINAAEPTVVLNIDTSHTEICFLSSKGLVFSRSIDYGLKHLHDEEIDKVLEQIELSFRTYYNGHLGPALKNIHVISPQPSPLLFSRIEGEFHIPVHQINAYGNVSAPSSMNLADVTGRYGLSLCVGLGLLHIPKRRMMDFIPKEVTGEKKRKLKKKEWLRSVVLCCLVIGLGMGLLWGRIHEKRILLEQVEMELEELSPKVEKAKERMEFIRSFKLELEKRIFIPDVLEDIVSLAPDSLSFRSLGIEDGRDIIIQGYAEESSAVSEFQSQLVKSPAFEEVNLQFATKRKVFRHEVTDFKITLNLVAISGQKEE